MQAAVASIGQISEIKGNGEVVRKAEKLNGKLALPIEQLDNIQTGNGRLEIKFVDDSTVKVTEHSKLVIDDFVYSGKPSTSKMALKFASGTARFATGQGGKMDKNNIALNTPTATIAVRGTDFATTVDDFGKSLIILLPDDDGKVGEITVSNAAGSVILTRAFQATIVSTMDSRPTRPVILNMNLSEIDNMLIVSPPEEDKKTVEVEDKRKNILDLSELDVDFLKDTFLTEESLSDSDLAIDQLKSDGLSEDLLTDSFLSGSGCVTKDNAKLCGTAFGFDAATQITTIMSGDYLRVVRSLGFVADVVVKKDAGKTIVLNINNKPFLIEMNDPVGGSTIIINQSN